MSIHFQKELLNLKKAILTLGAMVEEQVRLAAQSLKKNDANLSKKIIMTDSKIDEKEVEIEEECLKVLALHQPVAVDLRFLIAVIKINNELERLGDQAVNIAERVEIIAKQKNPDFIFDYSIMIKKARNMLKMSLDSLVNLDLDLAFKVLSLDDEVDLIKDEAYDEIKIAMALHTDGLGYLINLLLVSRHVERLADHATNIAEEVIYLIEGEIVRHGKIKNKQ
jgi:phosphate transport system protein